ncbi:TetR/AcrR family transcriptional regulator [Pradoshia sp.]
MAEMEDRRAVRTKKNLKKALLTLLKEKDLLDITITEVAQFAGCNRVTFYSHYRDLQALLAAIVDDYLDDLVGNFRKGFQNRKSFAANDVNWQLPIFEFIYENQFIFSLILKGEVLPGSQNQFCESLVKVSGTELELKEEDSEVEIPALNYFLTYGSLGFFLYWAMNDFKEPPEVMAQKLAYLQGKMFIEARVRT